MKQTITILSIVIISIYACNDKHREKKSSQETPSALQDKSDYSISKRYDGDLLESLYIELVEKTPELKSLEKQIDDFNSRKSDSTEEFDKFQNKNNRYYNSAQTHLEAIKDSILREKIKTLLTNSQSNLSKNTSNLESLNKQLNDKSMSLNDLHIVLKISRTLDLIEKYQKENLPDGKPIESILKDLDKIIQRTDSLTKK